MVSLQLIQFGAVGAGALIPVLVKSRFDGEVPYIGQYMMGYGNYSTGGSVFGGAALVAADMYFHKMPAQFAQYTTPLGVGAILGGLYNCITTAAGVTATSVPRTVQRVQASPRVEKLVY